MLKADTSQNQDVLWGGIKLSEVPLPWLSRLSPQHLLASAEKELKDFFEVENLSIIERWHLRHILQECLKEVCEHRLKIEQGQASFNTQIDPIREAAILWVQRLYVAELSVSHPMAEIFMCSPRTKDDFELYKAFNRNLKIMRDLAHNL